MNGKILGKITKAEFGIDIDYPFLIGLYLTFSLSDGGGVGCGGKYTVNISKSCKWSSETERYETYGRVLEHLKTTLKDAKANTVLELVGKPVEVIIHNNTFQDFRILTEVL